MTPWLADADGLTAEAVALAGDGSAAIVVTEKGIRCFREDGEWFVRRPAAKYRSFACVGEEHVVVWSHGTMLVLDVRTGSKLGSFECHFQSGVARRGALADGRIVLDTGEIVDHRGNRVSGHGGPPMFGGINDAAVDPTGRWLELAGSAGMDAGWGETIDLSTGESLGEGASGYGIDAVDVSANRKVVIIDDYMGLAAFRRGDDKARQLWLCGDDVLYFTRANHLVRWDRGQPGEFRVDVDRPGMPTATHDGSVVAVMSQGETRLHEWPADFGERVDSPMSRSQ